MRRSKVLLADDHTIVSDGLISLLKDSYELVGAVKDGQQLVEAAKRLRPDVIVADISMPVLSGLDALRRLKADHVDVKVIFLTMHADTELATEAVRAGALGFLLKQSAGDELLSAIEEVLHGRMYLTPAVTKDVIAGMSRGRSQPGKELTPRQRDVLRLIVAGRRMKEIASELNLSTRTVETHKYEIPRWACNPPPSSSNTPFSTVLCRIRKGRIPKKDQAFGPSP
jgi:DNA-binding NarL/FixJ family response regulator